MSNEAETTKQEQNEQVAEPFRSILNEFTALSSN